MKVRWLAEVNAKMMLKQHKRRISLLVVGFDDLSFRQENTCSKFNAFTLATCTIANSKQKFYTNGARAANKFHHQFGVNFS